MTSKLTVKTSTRTPLPCDLIGTLLEQSPSGFRARYTTRELRTGDLIRFHHRNAAGAAVVVWTRILGPVFEAGFYITN
jgi:hypothetical protein